MGQYKLSPSDISAKIKAGERFELSDGGGLTLAFREGYTTPVWRLRYRYANKPRVMILGSFRDLTLLSTGQGQGPQGER